MKIKKIADQSLQNQPISRDDALFLMQINGDEFYDLFYWANQIRLKYFGHSVKACSIVSAKQGRCTEDCSFCSQSSRYHTGIEEFPLIDTNRILDVAKCAEQTGSNSIGIVTSGYSINKSDDLDKICRTIKAVVTDTLTPVHNRFGCMIVLVADDAAQPLQKGINHNLETS